MNTIDETAHFANLSPQVPGGRTKSACLVRIHPAGGSGESMIDLGADAVAIGRDASCGIVLIDPRVSRRHAVLERVAGEYILRDLDSTNGTFVNDERIEFRKLTAGELIRIGDHVFKFLAGGHIELMYHQETAKIVSCDHLTSAYTKRYFLDRTEDELARCVRTGNPLSLLMMDIDFFKKVNDTHGHPVGDEVLREFSRRCRSVIHRDDVFARYGGEEFAVLLPCTNVREAAQIGERCRRVVSDEPFTTSAGKLEITASLGAACVGEDVKTVDLLIAAADERLYEAKRNGRNQVYC